MKHYLKIATEAESKRDGDPPRRVAIDFAHLETEIPELWLRVVLIRSRVKRLSYNFERDAQRALTWFNCITVGAAALAIVALLIGTAIGSINGSAGNGAVLAIAVVAAGTVAAVLASAANAFGAGRRASSMFAAKWSMRALALSIDQTVHLIAIEAENGKLTPAHVAKLEAATEMWLSTVTKTLSSFGSDFGAAFGNVVVPEVKMPGAK